MKKLIIILLLLSSVLYAADQKTTALTELTDVVDGDIMYIVDGATTSKKITVLNLFDTIDTSLKLLTILTNETGTGLSVFATSPTFTTSIVMGAADMSEVDLEKLDGITNGTASANKCLVADASIDIDLGTGDFDCTNLVVDGTANIIGATTLGTATTVAGNLTMYDAGTLTIYEDGDNFNITLVCNSGEAVGLLTGGLDISAALGVTGIVVLGDGGDNFSVASDGIDIDTSGNITNAGTIASGVITVTGLVNTSVGLDAVGAVDLDYGSVDVTDHTFTTDGGTFIVDGTITALGKDIGSTAAEWNDLFLNDGGKIQLGEGQDVLLTHVADTGVLLTGTTDEQLQFGDSGTYINQSTNGTLSLVADIIADITAPNIKLAFDALAYLNIATADGGITTITQVSDGTDEIRLGDGGDLISVASGNWDVSNAGVFSGMTGITSTGDIDFGGADLELPQGQTPDTDGDVDLDFTDGSLVIQHGSAHAELGAATDVVMGKLIKSFSATIFAPDSVNDVIPVKPIVAGEFPHGVVVTEIHMVVGTDSNYTIDVENWDDFDTISAGNPSINSTAYTAGNNGEVTDSAITFATIAAGQIIMIDIPATDIDWVSITIFYYEPIS